MQAAAQRFRRLGPGVLGSLAVVIGASPQGAVAKPAAKLTPIPTYQIEALTTTGMGPMAMGGDALMQMMMGGPPAMGSNATRSLELRLHSPRVVPNPTAEHRIPPGLALGTALPLTSTSLGRGEAPTWADEQLAQGKGRLLLFRGCAESASADQPEIVSLQGWTAEQKRQLLQAMPPNVDASGTSGTWPSSTSAPPVPLQASLVGSHTVVSTYAPEIRFTVGSSHDFLAPVALTSAPAAAGAQRLSWQVLPTALGYQATATGAGQQEGDIVMWTSSEAPRNDSGVPGDLSTDEAARLVQRQVLLPPERTSCAISAQAMAAMQGITMATLTAYGDTLQLRSPKGSPAWALSLERRSTATLPLGLPMEAEKGKGFNPFGLF